jgi:protein-S-isoprenylcysteine O-methyltransferase Ste14
MYVAVVLVLSGEAILFQPFNLVVYALLAWLACHLFVVFYEEATLKKKFGGAYEAYWQAVPRWILRFPQRHRPS